MATTWKVIIYILRQSRSELTVENCLNISERMDDFDSSTIDGEKGSDNNEDGENPPYLPFECDTCSWSPAKNYFGGQRSLATIWAAVKTELLTYRRLTEEDAWLSPHFDMDSLAEGLEAGGKATIPLVKKKMMKCFCKCGRFQDEHPECTRTDEACAYYFSNLDDWDRTTFIMSPTHRWD